MVGKARLSKFRVSDCDKYHQWLIDDFLGIDEPTRSIDHPIRVVRAPENDVAGGRPTAIGDVAVDVYAPEDTTVEPGRAHQPNGFDERGRFRIVGDTPAKPMPTSTPATRLQPHVRSPAEQTSVTPRPIPHTPLLVPRLRELKRAQESDFSWRRFVASMAIGGAAGMVIVMVVRIVAG